MRDSIVGNEGASHIRNPLRRYLQIVSLETDTRGSQHQKPRFFSFRGKPLGPIVKNLFVVN